MRSLLLSPSDYWLNDSREGEGGYLAGRHLGALRYFYYLIAAGNISEVPFDIQLSKSPIFYLDRNLF